MSEHWLIIAIDYYTATKWAAANRWQFTIGSAWTKNGSTLRYVHSKESLINRHKETKVYLHESWNKRPDRDELASWMLNKSMEVDHASD
jgi:hypothetical protein